MDRQRAAIYCRISADREGRELGVERQEEDNRKLADRLRLSVFGVYVDNDVSASTRTRKKRPEYQRMLADARAGLFDVILAYTSSRITRKPRENEDLIELAEERGIRYEYVRSPSFDLNTANGRLIARVLAASDANEAEQTSERVLRAVQQRAEQGRMHGGCRPYGYENDGVTQRPAEVAVYKDCIRRLIAGESQTSIVRSLNDKGVPGQAGGKWTVPNFKRVMLKKRYVIAYPDGSGIREHSSGEYKAVWQGVISQQDHELVRAIYEAHKQPWARGLATGRKYLLSGLTRCGKCGEAMYGQCRTRESGTKQRRYRCKGVDNYAKQVGCGKVFRDAESLDEFVVECVLYRFDSPDMARALATTEDSTLADELVGELKHWNLRRKTLAVEHATKPYEDYDMMRSHVMGEIQRIEAELGKLHTVKARGSIPSGNMRAIWPTLTLGQQRDIIKLVIKEIKVNPGSPGVGYWSGHRFNPDDIEIVWSC